MIGVAQAEIRLPEDRRGIDESRSHRDRIRPVAGLLAPNFPAALLDAMRGYDDHRIAHGPASRQYCDGARFMHVNQVVGSSRSRRGPRMPKNQNWKSET